MEAGNKEYMNLPLDALKPYPGHIFAPYEGERLDGMVDSVKEHGVITPIIVRKIGENEYQILSGHNRVKAAKAAGLTEIKAVVHEGLKNDEAEFIVTETNLMQRSFADLKHSERARALKNHLEAVQKSSGGRGFRSDLVALLDDETSYQVGTKSDSFKKTGEYFAFSKMTAHRYVRIAKLPDTLLAIVDSGRLPMIPAVNVSFLLEDEMNLLAAVLTENPKQRVTLKAGEKLREEAGRLSKEKMVEILKGKPAVNAEKSEKKIRRVSMSTDMLDRLNELTKDTSNALDKVLRFYFSGIDSGEFDDIISELANKDTGDGDENATNEGGAGEDAVNEDTMEEDSQD